MLRGHVFKYHTFANEAFAHFIDTFLQSNMGVTKGCELSNTNNSVTIGAGYFCVKGRFLEIIGNETISNISDSGYYSLVCEIDLSKINTETELNQASIKIIKNTSTYPTLTQEDLLNGGSVYQYEFARFRIVNSSITDFTDRRTFLDFDSIYSQIDERFETLLNELIEELAGVQDRSGLMLANSFSKITGETAVTLRDGKYQTTLQINYPAGFNIENCSIISARFLDVAQSAYENYRYQSNGKHDGYSNVENLEYTAYFREDKIYITLVTPMAVNDLLYEFVFIKK